MIPALEWFATIGGIIAAFMISLDFGRRVTGWGFVLFTFASLAWIAYGLMDGEGGLLTQNVVLFGINLLGIYRYLIRKRPVSKTGE
jgi:hypothetical protein